MKPNLTLVFFAASVISMSLIGPIASGHAESVADDNGKQGVKSGSRDIGNDVQNECQFPIDDREHKRLEFLNKLEFMSAKVTKRCLPPPETMANDIDPHRSLFVHDRATLDGADFSLQRTLTQLAT